MLDNIYIENFRRIRKAFIPIRDGITVLTGNNGVGKSTIIEALLFNQYGKPKAGTSKDSIPRANRGDDELAYTSVDFTYGTTHYRCRRFITKKGSTLATLYSYTDDEYEALMRQEDIRHLDKKLGTEVAHSATGVTAAITQIVGLDYDGYKASLVATQKELDSLASLTKDKRKQFFLDLLGYSRLDKVKPIASQNVREKTSTRNAILGQSLDPDTLRESLKKTQDELASIEERVRKGNEYVTEAQRDAEETSKRLEETRSAHDRYKKSANDYEREKKHKADIQSQIDRQQAIIDGNAQMAKAYDENSDVSERLTTLKDRLSKATEYARHADSRDSFQASIDITEKKQRENDAKLASLMTRHGEEPNYDEAYAEANKTSSALDMAKGDLKRADQSIRRIKSLIQDVDDGKTARCPTCGSDVSSADGKAHLNEELARLSDEREKASARVPELDAELRRKHDAIDKTKHLLRTWNSDEKAISACKSGKSVLDDERKRTERKRDAETQWLDEHRQDAIDDAETRHLNDEVADLERQQRTERQARTAFYAVDGAKKQLGVLKQSMDEANTRLDALSRDVADGEKAEEEYASLSRKYDQQSQKLKKYRDAIAQRMETRGHLTSQVATLRQQIESAERQRRQVNAISRDIEVWEGVRTCVDSMRETLPARITPTLSEEASRLLDVATGGTYSMLDIDDEYEVSVYTDTGVRPMSQMSGGEQDIVSLCIRIAIAELILESTGETAQTMVLDEIFGALDDSRKQEACDALRNLRSSLPRILCITHVDEIKDMADWTFVVEKDETGSSTIREITEQNVMRGE